MISEPRVPYGTQPIFKYEKLHVYTLARQLRKRFYDIARSFPSYERYGLTSQLQRSAMSVVLNIVEGVLRTTGKDQAKFTSIAYGSLHEAFVCVGEAEDERYVQIGTQDGFRQDVDQLSRMLHNLRQFQLRPVKS